MPAAGSLLERLPFPAACVRWQARRSLRRRLERLRTDPSQDPVQRRRAEWQSISAAPIFAPGLARLSHDQLPLAFWRRILGTRLHAGAAFWPRWAKDIHQAEIEWCKLVAQRSELREGHRVLEIGVLPGPMARWAEAELPSLEVALLALDPGGAKLLQQAVTELGPADAAVIQSTLLDFSPPEPFDRIIAVEALSHCANPGALLRRILSWLAPNGRLFVQLGCHWRGSYRFGPDDEHRWMLPDTPDGALFPGEEYLGELGKKIEMLSRWELSGEHYERTARAWGERMRNRSSELLAVLEANGQVSRQRTLRTWRNALLAQEAMYGYREGQEWCLSQLLLGP